jgi:hypothetical protein
MAAIDPDLSLRQEAVAQARRLAQSYDDLVPIERLKLEKRFETFARSAP